MKSILLSEYQSSMGPLIDVRNPIDYKRFHDSRSINIYADKLILNHKKYLDKNKTYYIICEKGVLSSKVVRTLSYFGYKLVQVKY